MSKLPKRHFWEWFKRHHHEFLALDTKSKKEAGYWLRELNAHLRAYFKFFGFSLTCPHHGTARLTITVKGKAMHFKKAEAFVATAPHIPGWCIQALEDPMPVDLLLEKQLEETGIDPWDFHFSIAGDHPEDTVIIIYHPLYTADYRSLFWESAYETVYHLLGERSFGMHISYIGVDNLSNADPGDVHPLEELSAHIGWRLSSMVVDGNGTLLDMH